MTIERVNEISTVLAQDVEVAKSLLEMSPEEAAAKLNADGFEVSADELIDYGEELKKMNANAGSGELNEKDLENASGGIAFSTALLIGVVAGYAMSQNKW